MILAATPTPKRLVEFAHDYPDRWANMAAIFARLSGYSEKLEVTETHVHMIGQLSDSQLRAALAELDQAKANPEALERLLSDMSQTAGVTIIDAVPSMDAPVVRAAPQPTKKKKKKSSKLDKPFKPLKIKRRS